MDNYIRRDSIVLVGGLAIVYSIAKIFCIQDIHLFLYTSLMLIISIMMMCMYFIMYESIYLKSDTTYRIATVMFNFQGLSMIMGLLMNMTNHQEPVIYIMMLFECNLLELLCVPFFLKYVGKQISQERIVLVSTICFFVAILISKSLYYCFGIKTYQKVMAIIAIVLMLSSITGIRLVKENRWRLSTKGTAYLKAFFITRGIYYILGSYQTFTGGRPSAIPMRWILMYIKFIGMYFVGISLYYNCLEQTWNQLVENVRSTKEKIYSNSQDRDTIVNLSHELKTPINVIQSATQILRLDDKLEKSALRELQHIKYECNEAMKLITNMIDINKLRGGYLKTKYEVCNIISVVENIIEAFAYEYREANIVFNTNEEEVCLKADVSLLQRAGLYIIGTMLNHGQQDIYVDMEYTAVNKKVCLRIYATNICEFIKEHHKDVAQCKTEEIGDLLALQFIKRILELHHAEVVYETRGCVRINFINVIDCIDESVLLEDNIDYLREQIKSSYYSQ